MFPEADTLHLEDIEIVNFRAIGRATIPLHPRLTILIGENATGKTAVLEAIARVLWTLVRGLSSPTPGRGDFRMTKTDFRAEADDGSTSEPFRATDVALRSRSSIGPIGSHYRLDEAFGDWPRVKSDHERQPAAWLAGLLESGGTAPVLAFYRDNRGQLQDGENQFLKRARQGRSAAYRSAFASRVYFDEAVNWFEEAESAELRDQRERGPDFRDPRLDAVRSAIEKLVPEVSKPRMLGRPPKLAMTIRSEGQEPRLLLANQLSSGFRVMVALAMDLARRMADLNPHMDDSTRSPGVVLIDEVDLHLHPRWQQLVVQGLLTAFPNVQFVMTTHSPQVLTTLREENVIRLGWVDGELKLEPVPSTEGAESGRLLQSAMGVSERPPAAVSAFVQLLEKYLPLLRQGRADAPEARDILIGMQRISPDDPILATLDLERRRLAARRG